MRTRRNFKSCTIFHALVSTPFVFLCVSVGFPLKSLCVLQLAGKYWHCQGSKEGESEALGLQVTISKVPWSVWSGWGADGINCEWRLLPCTGWQSSEQLKEHKGQKTSWWSFQATYQKQRTGGFLCATKHTTTFYSFGNLPGTYSKESKEFTSPMCSGFQSSHIGKFYTFWASEKQLMAPAAWDIWAIWTIELLIMLFTLRPVWHQALWLILHYRLISKLSSGVKCCDSWHER